MIILYLLNSLFLGLTIISFIRGNSSQGLVFLGIVGIITIIGITINYLKYKANEHTANNIFDSYLYKVGQLYNTPNLKQSFTLFEIANELIDLKKAEESLTSQEFDEVLNMCKGYQEMHQKIYLNLNDYLSVCKTIISWFDIFAPYYKYCRNSSQEYSKEIEEQKEIYRIKVRELSKDPYLTQNDVDALRNEFHNKFYNDIK